MNAVSFSAPEGLLHSAQALLQGRNLLAASDEFDRAEHAGADSDTCAAGRWSAHMLMGDFAAAWRESDAIHHRAAPDPNRFWQGGTLRNKRIIVRCLHGFGDAVQFLRFVPRLRELATEIVIEVPPRMLQLAHCFGGVDRVTTWGPNATIDPFEWEVQVEITELPYLFRIEVSDLPLATCYLHPSVESKQSAAIAMGKSCRPRVGIVWAAGEWKRERSIPLHFLQRLLQTEGFEFWSLQGGESQKEWSGLAIDGLRDTAICGDGMMALAASISQLDLVLTVDTLAAHLAGAMGTPAWLMLQHAADWRWTTQRNDSPWYPSVRLFRQPSAGDWQSVVCAVDQALKIWSTARKFI